MSRCLTKYKPRASYGASSFVILLVLFLSFVVLFYFDLGGITGLAVYQPTGQQGSPTSDSNPQFNGTDQNANFNGSSVTVSQTDGDSTALEQNLTQENVTITIVSSDFDPGSILSGNYSLGTTTGSEGGVPFNGTNATSDVVLGEKAGAFKTFTTSAETAAETPTGATAAGGGGGGGSSKGKTKTGETEEETLEPIHEPGAFFDVSASIPKKYRKLLPGEELIAEIIIENTRRIGAVTVTLDYSIEDESGENFFTELETKTISDKISYLKKIELPEDLEPGKYQLLVKLKYEDDIALAGYSFEVIGEEELPLFGRAASVVSGKTIRSYSLYAIGFIVCA